MDEGRIPERQILRDLGVFGGAPLVYYTLIWLLNTLADFVFAPLTVCVCVYVLLFVALQFG